MRQLKHALRFWRAPSTRLVAAGTGAGVFLRRALRWWWVFLVILVAAGTGLGVLRIRGGAGQTASLYEVFTVGRGSLVAAIAPTGEVYAPRRAELSFDVSKLPLTELHVTPGQQVKAGDVLARIDLTTLERAVTQAEADLTVAQDNLEKARNPYSELDLTQSRLSVTQAEIALEDAQ